VASGPDRGKRFCFCDRNMDLGIALLWQAEIWKVHPKTGAPMNAVLEFLIVTLPNLILVALALALAFWTIVMPLFSRSQTGVVAAVPEVRNLSCLGNTAYNAPLDWQEPSIQVRLQDGRTIPANISSCSLCLGDLKPGDAVILTDCGERVIAQRIPRWWSGMC